MPLPSNANLDAKPDLRLTSGRLLARNTLWNLIGNCAPMLVALFCIPILIRGLGKERFGVLTLAWALIGYANLFDLGLGRALTQLVAKKLGAGEEREIASIAWTSLLLMLLLGMVGTAALIPLSPWLVHRTLNVPVVLQHETLRSFYLLGISIPVVIATSGLRGLLEAHQRFDLINMLRVPMGVFSYAGPLLVLPFSHSLFSVVAALMVGRLVGLGAHLLLCFRAAPELLDGIVWHRTAVGPLLRFGGWMTVSNVVGPLMVTLDRFVIGALVSMTAVAYYATPFEAVTKLWIIPSAFVGVMFPAFSASLGHDRNRASLLYRRSVKYLLLILFPIVLIIMVLAKNALTLWLGAEFAQNSTHILQWLAVGVFINSLALVPFTMIQGAGRPDITAKLHLMELPVYLAGLWWLVRTHGVEGAAIAWTARVAVDAMILFFLANRCVAVPASRLRRTVLPILAALLVLPIAGLPDTIAIKVIVLIVSYLTYGAASWFLVLSRDDRVMVLAYLRPAQTSS